MKRVGLVAFLRYLEVCISHSIPQRKEAVHATYLKLHGSPTGVPLRLHRAQLSNLSRPHEWLVPVLPPSLHHRTHSGQRLDPRRSPQLLSSLLQRPGLGSRLSLFPPGPRLDPPPSPHPPAPNPCQP